MTESDLEEDLEVNVNEVLRAGHHKDATPDETGGYLPQLFTSDERNRTDLYRPRRSIKWLVLYVVLGMGLPGMLGIFLILQKVRIGAGWEGGGGGVRVGVVVGGGGGGSVCMCVCAFDETRPKHFARCKRVREDDACNMGVGVCGVGYAAHSGFEWGGMATQARKCTPIISSVEGL